MAVLVPDVLLAWWLITYFRTILVFLWNHLFSDVTILFFVCIGMWWGLFSTSLCVFHFFSFSPITSHSQHGWFLCSSSPFSRQNPLFSSFHIFFSPKLAFFFGCFSDYDEYGRDEFSFGNRGVPNGVDREGPVLSKLGSSSTAELHPKTASQVETKPTSMPPASVMTRLILIMVWRKLIRNPNTYSSLIGLTWSLVSFK